MAILDPGIRRRFTPVAHLCVSVAVLSISIPVAAIRMRPPSTSPDAQGVALRIAEPTRPAGAQAQTETTQRPESPPQSTLVLEGNVTLRGPGAKVVFDQLPPGSGAAAITLTDPKSGNVFTVQRERNRGRAIDRALVEAAEDGDTESINTLLQAGVDVNVAVDGDGTPLIVAARRGRLDIVRLLLDRGADPNKPVDGDGSPLIMAALEDRREVAALLISRGANVNQIVDGDENPLIQASGRGHLDMVKFLVSKGADVNARVWVNQTWTGPDKPGAGEWRSPLSMARKGGHADVVAYLMSIGAFD